MQPNTEPGIDATKHCTWIGCNQTLYLDWIQPSTEPGLDSINQRLNLEWMKPNTKPELDGPKTLDWTERRKNICEG